MMAWKAMQLCCACYRAATPKERRMLVLARGNDITIDIAFLRSDDNQARAVRSALGRAVAANQKEDTEKTEMWLDLARDVWKETGVGR